MNSLAKRAGLSAVALATTTALVLTGAPAQAGDDRDDRDRGRVVKVDRNTVKVVVKADDDDVVKLQRRMNGKWKTIRTWRPKNDDDRRLVFHTDIRGGVGKIKNYRVFAWEKDD